MRRFQQAGFMAAVAAALLVGCGGETTVPPGPEPHPTVHVIRDIDYQKDRYFFFDHPLVFVGPELAEPFGVYLTVTPQDLLNDPTLGRFSGRAFVDSAGFGSSINNAMAAIAANIAADSVVVAPPPSIQNDFRLLNFGVEYIFVTDSAGEFVGLELVQPLTDVDRTLAVHYTNKFGDRIGGKYSDYGIGFNGAIGQRDTLALEILRPRDPAPDGVFAWTWSYTMRHVYNLGFTDIGPARFELEIEDVLYPRRDPTRPEGEWEPYLRIFGLDQYDRAGNPNPDGIVDPWAVDFTNGTLEFPYVLAPMFSLPQALAQVAAVGDSVPATGFAPDHDFVEAWTDSFSFHDPRYADQWAVSRRIYTEQLTPNEELNVHQYVIRATVR